VGFVGQNLGHFAFAESCLPRGFTKTLNDFRVNHKRGSFPLMDIITFDPAAHRRRWEEFIESSYSDPNYIMLSPAFLRWQFFDNPANQTGAYTLWLVVQRDAIIAQLGFVPFIGLTPTGQRFQGAYPINLMVRPEYRSVGVGAILLTRLLKQIPCLINPGVNQAGATLGEGLGMRDLGYLRRYVAVIDGPAARMLAVDGQLPASVQEAVPADAAAAQVVASSTVPEQARAGFAFPQPSYGAERNRHFLRWRYDSHPAFTYEFLFSSNYTSVLVFHEEREKSTGALIIRVVDVLARPEHQAALFHAVLLAAKARAAAIVDFFCSLGCYDAALKAAGFFNEAEHSEGRIATRFQPLDFRKTGIRVFASYPDWSDGGREDWYITKADSDQDRPNDKRAIGDAAA
jgi:GNAT superfamily N-acetyltransferase